ncbi:hypothetical protein [Paraburkholderia hospita]|uniref:hypothetical protein n=1 Tax=Paraburkholderia hospita TaxID=169430 RepID=UPI000B3498B3|nr:hypothetical protein [Paraburkholderia hospita]
MLSQIHRRPEHLNHVATPACNRGFLVGISLNGGHKRNIFSGKGTIGKRFETDLIYIRDFSEDYRADLFGNFDFGSSLALKMNSTARESAD